MKYISKIVLVLILSLTFFACSEDEVTNSNEQKLFFKFIKTTKTDVARISNWINKNNKQNILTQLKSSRYNKSKTQIDLDYENSVTYHSNGKELIVINQKGLDITNYKNYAVSFIKDNGVFKPTFLIKTINESDDIKKVEYYDFKKNHLFTIVFDIANQTITNLRTTEDSSKSPFNLLNKTNVRLKLGNPEEDSGDECSDSYGGAVAECMDDIYTKRGWLSVWYIVQTAFIPETAAVVAIACAIDEYPEGGECYKSFF